MMIRQPNNTSLQQDYQKATKTNYDKNKQKTSNFNQMHIFTKGDILSPSISLLKTECKRRQIPISNHENGRQLISLINSKQQKIFIVIQSTRDGVIKSSSVFPQTFSFPKVNSKNIKIISYPAYINHTKYQCAKDKNQVIQFYQGFFNQKSSGHKIKLKKVSCSKNIKYAFAPLIMDVKSNKKMTNQQLKQNIIFEKLLINEINLNPNSQFNAICECFSVLSASQQRIQKIYKLNQIKDHIVSLKQTNKLLILLDQDNLLNILNYLQKSNIIKKVQLIVFGQLKQPKKQIFTANILLATINQTDLIHYLNKIGLKDIVKQKNKYQQIIQNQKNEFIIQEQPFQSKKSLHSNISINNNLKNTPKFQQPYHYNKIIDRSKHSIFSNASSYQQRFMRNWVIQKDTNNNYIQFQESKQLIQSQSIPMSLRASRITKKNTSSESQVSIFNKQTNNIIDQQNKLNFTLNSNNAIKTKNTDEIKNQNQIKIKEFDINSNNNINNNKNIKSNTNINNNIKNNSNNNSNINSDINNNSNKEINTNIDDIKKNQPRQMIQFQNNFAQGQIERSMQSNSNVNVKKILKISKKPQKQQLIYLNKPNINLSSNIIHQTSQQHRASNKQSSNILMQQFMSQVISSNNQILNSMNSLQNNNIKNNNSNLNNSINNTASFGIINSTSMNKIKISETIKNNQQIIGNFNVKSKESFGDLNILRIDSIQSGPFKSQLSNIGTNIQNMYQKQNKKIQIKQPSIQIMRKQSIKINSEKQMLPIIDNINESRQQIIIKQTNNKILNKQQQDKINNDILQNDELNETIQVKPYLNLPYNLGYHIQNKKSTQIQPLTFNIDPLYCDESRPADIGMIKFEDKNKQMIEKPQQLNIVNNLGYDNNVRHIPIVINNQYIQPYIIDGLTGQMEFQSFKRFNDNIQVPGYNFSSIKKLTQIQPINANMNIANNPIQSHPNIINNYNITSNTNLLSPNSISNKNLVNFPNTINNISSTNNIISNQNIIKKVSNQNLANNLNQQNNYTIKQPVPLIKRITNNNLRPQVIESNGEMSVTTINGYNTYLSSGSLKTNNNIKQINMNMNNRDNNKIRQIHMNNGDNNNNEEKQIKGRLNQQSKTSIKIEQNNRLYSYQKYDKNNERDQEDIKNVTTTKKIHESQNKYIYPSNYAYIADNVKMNQTASKTLINNNSSNKIIYNTQNNQNTTQNSQDGYITKRYPSNNYLTQPIQVNRKVYTLSSPYSNDYNTQNKNQVQNQNLMTNKYQYPYKKSQTYNIQNTNNKQPDVIQRIYIKASDLPERTIKYNQTRPSNLSNNKNNQTVRNQKQSRQFKSPQRIYPLISTNQNKVKLSRQDLDPFHQKQSQLLGNSQISKGGKRGSYLRRKQDGYRDPFSAYEQNNNIVSPSRLKQKSNIKQVKQTHIQPVGSIRTYTAEQYKKVLSQRQNSKNKSNNIYVNKPNIPKNNDNHTYISSPVRQVRIDQDGKIHGINLNQMEKTINQNGTTVYKQKQKPSFNHNIHKQQNIYVTSNLPRENNYKQNNFVNGYQNVLTRYQPTGKQYANSPTKKQGVNYQKNLNIQNPLKNQNRTSFFRGIQKINPLRSKQQYIKPLIYNQRSPMKVSEYKADKIQTYHSPNKHVYQRRQIVQPLVQASFQPRIINNKQQQDNSNSISMTNQNGGSGIDRFSQTIELSDGSVMRRNNIKFGVNKYNNKNKIDESYYLSQMKSKLKDRNMQISSALNKPVDIKKNIYTEADLQRDMKLGDYEFIDTGVNSFHFLIDQDLKYLQDWIKQSQLCTKNDKIEIFRGIDDLYNKMKLDDNCYFDGGFIFPNNEQMNKIKKNQILDDYYLVQIIQQNYNYNGLTLNSKQHLVKLSKLTYLKSIIKMVIQPKITNVILCQMRNKDEKTHNDRINNIIGLFDFSNQQFIKQYFDDSLKLQNILNLIDDPILTRFYIICSQEQIKNVQNILQQLKQLYSVPKQITRIIALSQNQHYNGNQIIYNYNQNKVMIIPNSLNINNYKQFMKIITQNNKNNNKAQNIKNYEQNNNNNKNKRLQNNKIYYDQCFRDLSYQIEKQFPSRFELIPFKQISQVHKIITSQNQINKLNQNYLIIHPIMCDQYVDSSLFRKVFMLGKSNNIQKRVIKVNNNKELIQLLRN